MSDIEPEALSRSLVLVTDYRVPDPSRVWPLLERQRDALAHLGARHVLVYTSAVDPGRVLAVLAIRAEQPVVDILRDRAFMQWFDDVGVDDIPAVFAGSLVERIAVGDPDPDHDLAEPPDRPPDEPPEAVVAAVAEVADAATLIAHVHATAHDFAAAGIRKVLVFQAFDNPREVFMLQETTEEVAEGRAGAWISQPAFSDDWITRAGVGVYPPVFVGHLAHLMRI